MIMIKIRKMLATLTFLCCMALLLAGCSTGSNTKTEAPAQEQTTSEIETEAPSETETEAPAQEQAPSEAETEALTQEQEQEQAPSEADTDTLTQEQALEAVKSYCIANNPELESMAESDEYTIYWDVTTNEKDEIVVLFRSYTGSESRYYVDPVSGETYVTERVPGIIEDEQRTDESFNVRDYA